MTNLKPFDIIKTIKERYINVSQDIIEKNDKDKLITMDSFDISDPELIKLKNENGIKLKKCLIDEIGLSNFKANGFEPVYNIYKKEIVKKNKKENEKEYQIIVKVETPGNCKIETSEIYLNEEYNVIKLTGEKKKDKEPENPNENIHDSREFGKFILEIPLKMSEYHLINKLPSVKINNGVYILGYDLETINKNNKLNANYPNPEPL